MKDSSNNQLEDSHILQISFRIILIVGLSFLVGLYGCESGRHLTKLNTTERREFIDANTMGIRVKCSNNSREISQRIEKDCREVLKYTRLRIVDDEEKADAVLRINVGVYDYMGDYKTISGTYLRGLRAGARLDIDIYLDLKNRPAWKADFSGKYPAPPSMYMGAEAHRYEIAYKYTEFTWQLASFLFSTWGWDLLKQGHSDSDLEARAKFATLLCGVLSPDGQHIAYIDGNFDILGSYRSRVIIDSQKERWYDGIGKGTPVFSPDSQHVAYIAQKGNKQIVIVDGEPGPEYDGIGEGSLVFSPDSRRVEYSARKGDKWIVVVDGENLAYIERKGDKQIVVVDDHPGPEYDGIAGGTPVFSHDGKRVAYVAKKGDKWIVVVDGEPGPQYDRINCAPFFGPDDKRVAYVAKKDGKWIVVVDGEAGPQYDGIMEGSPVFSPNGLRVAYSAKKGDKWIIVVDGEPGPAYDGIAKGDPVFSPDSNFVKYRALKNGKWLDVSYK